MTGKHHTPGPWLDWETLEWIYEPSKLLTNTADARLIAAAPELLELAFQYRDDLRHPPAPDSRERRLKAINAVLAKAEGRS